MQTKEKTDARLGLYKKLLNAQQAITKIEKDGRNKQQGYSYASAENIISETRKAFHAAGLIVLPSITECHDQFIESIKTNQQTGETVSRQNVLARIQIEMKIIDVETGDSETVTFYGHGYDPTDKAIYKAITGASKYALLQILQVPTGDDPEHDSGDGHSGRRSGKKGDSGDNPGTGKSFGSKYGTDKKPGKCGFCGKDHIVKNMPMVYIGKVCGAKACAEAYTKSKSKTTDDAGGKADGKAETEGDKIDALERKDILTHIRAGEKEITGGDPDAVADIREANLNSPRLDTSHVDELRVYLRWLVAQVKATKG